MDIADGDLNVQTRLNELKRINYRIQESQIVNFLQTIYVSLSSWRDGTRFRCDIIDFEFNVFKNEKIHKRA